MKQEEGIKRSLPYYRHLYREMEVVTKPHWGWWLSVLGGMAALAFLAFQSEAQVAVGTELASFFSQRYLKELFYGAVLVHVGEAFYAWNKARKANLKSTARGWFWQNFLLGYPSLRLLLNEIKQRKNSNAGK